MREPVSSYSLPGIRTATAEPQQHLTMRAIEVLAGDDRILAGWLVGGFAVGDGDAFSDVDLQCTIRDDAVEDLRTSWPELVNRIAPTVRISPFPTAIGGLCITPAWLHFDIVFNPQSALDPSTVVGMEPLFDKAGILPTHAVPRPDRTGEPFFPTAAVDMFLYMLGNMVSVVGRDEVIPGSNGVVMVRDIALVGLLLAEQGRATTREHTFGNPFPFTKRLRRYLNDEQHALLESLPPLTATWDSIIDGYIALARAFLPRARRLADVTGTPWPADYERATIDYFERMLGVDLASRRTRELTRRRPTSRTAPSSDDANGARCATMRSATGSWSSASHVLRVAIRSLAVGSPWLPGGVPRANALHQGTAPRDRQGATVLSLGGDQCSRCSSRARLRDMRRGRA